MMNKIIHILCSAAFLLLSTVSGFSQGKVDSLKVFVNGDTLRKQITTDTIKRKLALDSIQTVEILKKLIESDSVRHKLKTDTVKKRVALDSIQTKNLLEKLLSKAIKQKKETKEDIEYEVDGMIVPNTISRAGRDFYDIFFSKWVTPKGVRNFIIEIREKPIPQMGTEITIIVKDIEIFQEKVQPRYDIIEEYAKFAINVVRDFLKHYNEIQKELNGEDMSGSGMF